jgi:hypothetical protein
MSIDDSEADEVSIQEKETEDDSAIIAYTGEHNEGTPRFRYWTNYIQNHPLYSG